MHMEHIDREVDTASSFYKINMVQRSMHMHDIDSLKI